MALIDSTYFIRDISLDVGVNSNIDSDITKYERQLIYEIFDYVDAEKVLTYTPSSGVGDQWVIDLVDGKDYTVSGTTYKWVGLVNTLKESPIAYYVYYYHLRNIQTFTGGSGIGRPKHENADTWSAGVKTGAAWIRMENLLSEMSMMLSNEHSDVDYCITLGNVNAFDF